MNRYQAFDEGEYEAGYLCGYTSRMDGDPIPCEEEPPDGVWQDSSKRYQDGYRDGWGDAS